MAMILGLPSAALAECVAIEVNGQPAWQLTRIGSGGDEYQRMVEACKACPGGTPSSTSDGGFWCKRTPGASGASSGYDPKQLQYVGRAIDEYAQTGQVSQWTGGMAGFEIGVALHESLKRNAAIAAEKKRLEELRKVEEERQRRIREARELEEKWSKLLPQMKLSSDANVAMKLDDVHRELGFKFEGSDPSLSDPSNRELMLKDRSTCFFQDCRDKYEMPGDSWSTPYVDLRHLRRGVAIAKQTRYAPGDQRDWILGQAMNAAQGGATPTDVPADAVVLPPNALTLLQDASIDRKIATDARIAAATEADSAQRGRDMVAAVLADAKKDADPRDAERKKFIAGMETDLKRRDVEIAQRKKELGAAQAAEKASVEREKRLLGGLSTHDATNGRPVERCGEEQKVIARMREGLPQLDQRIKSIDAIARQEKADARASIAKAKQESVRAYVKIVEKAFGAYLDAVVVEAKAIQFSESFYGGQVASSTIARRQALESYNEGIKKLKDAYDIWKLGTDSWQSGKSGYAASKSSEHDVWGLVVLVTQRLDEAGATSQAGEALLKRASTSFTTAKANRILLYAMLGEAYVRVGFPTAEAVKADWRAEEAKSLAESLREYRAHLTSSIDEREARVKEITAAGGCLQ